MVVWVLMMSVSFDPSSLTLGPMLSVLESCCPRWLTVRPGYTSSGIELCGRGSWVTRGLEFCQPPPPLAVECIFELLIFLCSDSVQVTSGDHPSLTEELTCHSGSSESVWVRGGSPGEPVLWWNSSQQSPDLV